MASVSAPSVAGVGDMFLMVKGAKCGLIKGEAQDDDTRARSRSCAGRGACRRKSTLGGGVATGKASVRELQVVKRVDSASTALMTALRTNELIEQGRADAAQGRQDAARVPQDRPSSRAA